MDPTIMYCTIFNGKNGQDFLEILFQVKKKIFH